MLHNGNVFAPLHTAHSVHMKGNYIDLATILGKIKYQGHQWMVVQISKYLPCFWVSREVIQNILDFFVYGIVEPNRCPG